jgi:hypothetical protein
MTDNNTKNSTKHPLREKIGCLLDKFKSRHTNTKVFLDEACSGINKSKQQISLFAGDVKNKKSRLCKVDAMIVKDGYCKIVVEIEESGFIPTKICGKYLTTALSTHYLRDNEKIELDKKELPEHLAVQYLLF